MAPAVFPYQIPNESPTMILTPRDGRVLRLASAARLFLLPQAALLGGWTDLREARRRLRLLVSAGYLRRLTVHACPSPLLPRGPLLRWDVGDPAPDYAALSRLLTRRRAGQTPRPLHAYVSSERWGRWVGSGRDGRLTQPLQATHDSFLASIFCHYVLTLPELADLWFSEDIPGLRSGVVADATLQDADGNVIRAVEACGHYPQGRVGEICDFFYQTQTPFECW